MKFPPPPPRSMVSYETSPMPCPSRATANRNDRLEERKRLVLSAVSNHVRMEIEARGSDERPDLLQDSDFKESVTNLVWAWVPQDTEELEEIFRYHGTDLRALFFKFGVDEKRIGVVFDSHNKRLAIFYYLFDQVHKWYHSNGARQIGHYSDTSEGAKLHFDETTPRPIRVVPR